MPTWCKIGNFIDVFLARHVSGTSAHHQKDQMLSSSIFFYVLLTVHLSTFISVFNQLDAQNLFHNKFYFMPLHVSSTCAHHQEVKIALHSLWYHHTETSEWSKIQFYKYEQIVVKFMCKFFRCDYCVLLSVNMLCHVEVTFIPVVTFIKKSP